MSDLQLGAADPENLSASEGTDLTDQGSQSTAGAKRKGGRLHSDAWETFKKVPNPNPGSTRRNYIGVCKFCECKITSGKAEHLRAHAASCTKANPEAQLAARVQQVRAGGGREKTSSQMSLNSYADTGKDRLSKEQNKVLQRLLTLAFIMCGIPFACVGNAHMKHVLKCLKPSFAPPGRLTDASAQPSLLSCRSAFHTPSAGITTMRTTVLDGLYSEVVLQHAAWLADDILARHLTLTLDGWFNARMESIHSFNIIFPDRRVILLKESRGPLNNNALWP